MTMRKTHQKHTHTHRQESAFSFYSCTVGERKANQYCSPKLSPASLTWMSPKTVPPKVPRRESISVRVSYQRLAAGLTNVFCQLCLWDWADEEIPRGNSLPSSLAQVAFHELPWKIPRNKRENLCLHTDNALHQLQRHEATYCKQYM